MLAIRAFRVLIADVGEFPMKKKNDIVFSGYLAFGGREEWPEGLTHNNELGGNKPYKGGWMEGWEKTVGSLF